MKKPTVIGGSAPVSTMPVKTVEVLPAASPLVGANQSLVTLPPSFPVQLADPEIAKIHERLATLSIVSISGKEIALLEQGPQVAFGRILDGLLGRIDSFDNPAIYELFTALSGKVKDQDLPALVARLNGTKERTIGQKIGEAVSSFITSPKARQAALDHAWTETKRLISGKSKTLADFVREQEKQLERQQGLVIAQIDTFEDQKAAYRQMYRNFALSAAFLHVFLEKAKAEVATRRSTANLSDPLQRMEISELDSKLQALESRTLAVLGSFVSLPGSEVLIAKMQDAGVSTLQETTTTGVTRFNNIKMTLLQLAGTMVVKDLQRVSEAGAVLDEQLAEVNSMLGTEVVTAAANAPGENRVRQAELIARIVDDANKMQVIVEEARVNNATNFAEARKSLMATRQKLLANDPIELKE